MNAGYDGDPLSPLLYVLCIEVLANLIRGSPRIKGDLLPGTGGLQAKVRLYTDDTALFLKDSLSLASLFELIDLFEKGTGAKLNRSKTEAMWLGAWKFCNDEPHGLTWVRKMKILGIVFGVVDTEQDNWQPKLNKLEKSLSLWKSRSLSLLGKALVVNVLGLSKLIYLARVLVLPAWVLSRVNGLIWPLIWNSRMETVSRNTCYLKTQSGGLGLHNFDLRCESLRLAGMAYTLGSASDSSFFLCKYFLGHRLSRLRPEWAFLRDNSAPSAFSPSSFYDSCLSILFEIADTKLSSKKV